MSIIFDEDYVLFICELSIAFSLVVVLVVRVVCDVFYDLVPLSVIVVVLIIELTVLLRYEIVTCC